MLGFFLSIAQYLDLTREPFNPVVQSNLSTRVTFASFSETECREKFRFHKEHLPRLLDAMRMPVGGFVTKNRLRVGPEEALLIFLARYTRIATLEALSSWVGRDNTQLSVIIHEVEDWGEGEGEGVVVVESGTLIYSKRDKFSIQCILWTCNNPPHAHEEYFSVRNFFN